MLYVQAEDFADAAHLWQGMPPEHLTLEVRHPSQDAFNFRPGELAVA